MSRTVGITPGYLEKLDDVQEAFILTAVGRRFYDEYLTGEGYGSHTFIFGLTKAGKTNKGYWLMDFLKHLELQIWFDSGKQGEILPILCQDRKVRIIVPIGTDLVIEELKSGKWQKIPDHPDVIPVSCANDAISSISPGSWDKNRNRVRDTITIISFRNFFRKKEIALEWITSFFENLAERCRDGTMPDIFPASLHIDETHWAMAGKRVSGAGNRTKASEAITENAMELRSADIREVLYGQDYTNIPPAARENMLFNIICHGGMVKSDENRNLSKWCVHAPQRNPPSPMEFKIKHGRFVFENGDSYPPEKPWSFRHYPKDENDRKWIESLRVRYEGKYDRRSEESEVSEECLSQLGRFQAMAIPPEKQAAIISRWESEGVITDE